MAQPPLTGSRIVEVLDTEEKGSDVNLASYLLMDGFWDEYDLAVVVSNDSDLQLPVEMARTRLGSRWEFSTQAADEALSFTTQLLGIGRYGRVP